MSKTVLFVVADEKHNAGERDYMKSLSANILRAPDPAITYLVAKIGDACSDEIATAAKRLPMTDAQYAEIPRLDNALDGVGISQIVGVGNSTVGAVIDMAHKHPGAAVSWITHVVEPDLIAKLKDANIKVFSVVEQPDASLDFQKISSVPHTNTEAACRYDYEILKDRFGEILRNDEPFAFVVLNAGFPVTDNSGASTWHPYKEEEARGHGFALGNDLLPGTNLILVDGGPRNLKDENEFGQGNMEAFKNAYLAGQRELGAEVNVLADRFVFGQPANIIKAGYMLAQKENCVAFISNSEGYGTMDAAILHVDNRTKLLGMFSFAAQYADPTGDRVRNIEKYNRLGVAVLELDKDGMMVRNHHDREQRTPVAAVDAAAVIVSQLGLLKPQAVMGARPAPILLP